MSESFTEVSHTGWLQRLMGAIVGVLIGLVLVPVVCFGIFWNEGRAVQTARSLAEGESAVVNVDTTSVDPANEGKLVHVQGDISTTAMLSDPSLLVQAKAVRLVRTVEMFQWQEESHTTTQKNVGGSEDKTTTYTYSQVWSEHRNDSSHFHVPANHGNPQQRYARFQTAARDATLGAFRPGPPALDQLTANQELSVDPAIADTLLEKSPQVPVSVSNGKLYFGADPGVPRVGDLRIGYQITPLGPASFIGRQTGADLTAYQTKAGDKVLMGDTGLVPASSMFKEAENDNRILTWILRAVLAVVLWIAWFLVFRPIGVVGDVIPLIGSILGAGAGLAALLLTVVMAPLVTALAWFTYRPVVALAALAVGIVLAAGFYSLVRGRRRQKPAHFLPA